jgi:hypothetical protein
VRRWTFSLLVLLFVALTAAVVYQFTLSHKPVRCPGPKARLGGPNDVVRCESPSPSAS